MPTPLCKYADHVCAYKQSMCIFEYIFECGIYACVLTLHSENFCFVVTPKIQFSAQGSLLEELRYPDIQECILDSQQPIHYIFLKPLEMPIKSQFAPCGEK